MEEIIMLVGLLFPIVCVLGIVWIIFKLLHRKPFISGKHIIALIIVTLLCAFVSLDMAKERDEATTSKQESTEYSSTQKKESEATTESKKKIKKTKKNDKEVMECEYDGTILKYKECKVTKDAFDDDALVLYFEFTNNSNENKSYLYTYTTKAFQHGVEIESSYAHVGQETRNAELEIQPGTSVIVATAHQYTGDDSEVTVEVEPWVSFTDKKLMHFKLNF